MRNFIKSKALAGAFTVSLTLVLGGCGGYMGGNRSLESVHQPLVERTNYVLDIKAGAGGITPAEQHRLAGWFEALDLRYGDRVSIDDPTKSGANRASIEAVAGRFGLLLGGQAPVTNGYVDAGTVRVVVTRSSAKVPLCPDWSRTTDTNFGNATSSNFGCATNSNLAAMVADPEHLLHGADSTGNTVVMSSTKAIETYREAKPTGEKGLKEDNTQKGSK